MAFARTSALVAFLVGTMFCSAALSACDCGGSTIPPVSGSCVTTADCRAGQTCRDSRCVALPDSGQPDFGMTVGDDLGDGCIDLDGDQRGEGCAAGPDCDDTNRARGGDEVCDTVDNDCDGETDEGFADVCTECVPGCAVSRAPGAAGWTPTPENAEGVIVDADGALTLGRTETRSFAVWVANQDEGTVSKLDSRTNTELARYPSARPDATNNARPYGERCSFGANAAMGIPEIGNCPSRTAVDQSFDAYVANRAFGNQGTLTKYANRESDCIDRNANGVIDTSRDLDGDGTISLTAAGEFVGVDDECISWTVPVGANDAVPRALAIGIAPPDDVIGDVWVGLYNAARACRLNPRTGGTIACLDLSSAGRPFRPYGASADEAGRIWLADRTNSRDLLGHIDASSTWRMASPLPGGQPIGTYGVTVDGRGHVFVANSDSEPNLLRYDIATDTWEQYTIPGGGSPRGVAADETSLWVGLSHNIAGFGGGWSSRIVQYDLATMGFVATHTMPTGLGPVGVGVSFDGSVWAICQGSNSAARLEPATGTWIEHAVGLTPYTYSDFIGFGLNTFAEPRGRYRFIEEGCPGERNQWLGARFRAETPPGTRVEIWVRSADSIAALELETWIGPFAMSPANLTAAPGPVPERRYLQVEIRLSTDDRRSAPRVFSVDVAGLCTPIIG